MKDYRQKSFWLATTEYQENPPLQGDLSTDVLIIGGGFSGMSSAYHIKQADPGTDVIVLEAEVTGYGASGRNGGFAMTVFGVSLTVTHMLHGAGKAREAYAYMVDAVEYLDRLVRTHQLQCDYERSGFLRAATTPGYVRRIQHEMELAARIGLSGIDWWDKTKTQDAVHSPLFMGGWWEPRCALVHPAKLVRELKRIAEEAGAHVYEHTPVEKLERTRTGIRAYTRYGRVDAQKVVFATNAWTHLFPWVRRKQVPAWTYMVATEPLSAAQWEAIGWEHRMGIEDARNLIHYFRPSPDGRLLMGGGPVILSFGDNMDKDDHPPTWRHLETFIHMLFPQLEGVHITHRWGGPFSATLDLVPALGYVGDKRAVYNVGCIGHGVSLMPSNGRIIADLVLERKTELTSLWFVNRRTLPWPPEPFRFLIGHGVRDYLRLEDWWYERKGLGTEGTETPPARNV